VPLQQVSPGLIADRRDQRCRIAHVGEHEGSRGRRFGCRWRTGKWCEVQVHSGLAARAQDVQEAARVVRRSDGRPEGRG
jgi:hypothetical protein